MLIYGFGGMLHSPPNKLIFWIRFSLEFESIILSFSPSYCTREVPLIQVVVGLCKSALGNEESTSTSR